MGKQPRALTTKQSVFIDEYLVDLNATQAAIRAGYSKKTAKQIGQNNLTKVVIAEAVQARMEERSERTEIDQDWVLKSLKRESDPDGECETTPSSRVAAVTQIGKHLKMFTEKVEHSGPDGGAIELTDTERRARVDAILDAGRDRRAKRTPHK